jgi:2-iminobutanoate/2-iminopropanoate deaminase
MKVTYITDQEIPHSHLPFSPAVRVGQLLFVSGQASVDDEGRLVPGSFEEEFRRSVANLKRIVEAAGGSLADVVQTRNYVRDPANVPAFNQLYQEYFFPPFPARTTITHCLPEALHFEIECVAVLSASAD